MKTIHSIFKTALLSLMFCAGAYAAEPLKKLSNTELDSVAAGYLTVEVFAEAGALGPITSTNTVTDVVVRTLSERDDGFIYTKGKGKAIAYAKGTDVYTFVDGMFDTDEEIVSVKIVYKTNKSKQGKNKKRSKQGKSKKRNKRGKTNKHRKSKKSLVTERSVYKIRVVTRVPAP